MGEYEYISMMEARDMTDIGLDGEMTAKEAIKGVLAGIRTVMSSELTMPDPVLEVSGFM